MRQAGASEGFGRPMSRWSAPPASSSTPRAIPSLAEAIAAASKAA